MFAWFVREGLIAETPFRFRGDVVIKLDRETPRSRRFATSTDEETLLGVAEPLLRDVIVAMLGTCCRPGEALKLRWRDVDFL
jgi:integrase